MNNLHHEWTYFNPIMSCLILYVLIIYRNGQKFLVEVERTYPLRCQCVDQDTDRDILSNLWILWLHKTKTQAICGLWVVVFSCPRDSIVMASTIDYWLDWEFATTITVHFRKYSAHGDSFICLLFCIFLGVTTLYLTD